jgi:hypothetical protein
MRMLNSKGRAMRWGKETSMLMLTGREMLMPNLKGRDSR